LRVAFFCLCSNIGWLDTFHILHSTEYCYPQMRFFYVFQLDIAMDGHLQACQSYHFFRELNCFFIGKANIYVTALGNILSNQ
jgi:hypothetical protein